jgi:hypothetical protein
MPTIEIEGDLLDGLAIKWLYAVADTQIHTILSARDDIVRHAVREDWETVQDCIVVLAAVNRLLDYCGQPGVDFAKAMKAKTSNV